MVDRKASALISSQATLDANGFNGKVLLSDVYSSIHKKFNMIISNPPFHDDLKKNFYTTKKIISESKNFLKKNGELRFVVNRCHNYDIDLEKIFSKFFIIDKNKRYKIYQAILK